MHGEVTDQSRKLIYHVHEKPPACISFTIGFQKILNTLCHVILSSHLLSSSFCLLSEDPQRSHLLSSILFFTAAATFIQTSIGTRLPLSLGVNFIYILTTVLTLNVEKCPTSGEVFAMGPIKRSTLWKDRITSVQGAIILLTLLAAIIGCTRSLKVILRFVSPLTIFPMIILANFSAFDQVVQMASLNWTISGLVVLLIVIFSQYLRYSPLPLPSITFQRGCYIHKTYIFQILAVPLAVSLTWGICFALTVTNSLPMKDMARTNFHTAIISHTPSLNLFYPFEFGWPSFSATAFFLMMPAFFISLIESIDHQNICSRVCECIPSSKKIHRGVLVENVISCITAAFGVTVVTTPSAQDVDDIRSTKVSSSCVVQGVSIILMILSLYGPFGAFLTLVPVPIIGALMFNSCINSCSQALSYLWYVDKSSKRNQFVIVFAVLFGYVLPRYLTSGADVIQTGMSELDNTLKVLMKSNVFVGSVIAFILDNTIPVSGGETGVDKWRKRVDEEFILSDLRTCASCRSHLVENGNVANNQSRTLNAIETSFLSWIV